MTERISDHDEFLLSRLLDGDLPEEEATELRARLEREPGLRAALGSLSRVDEALRQRRADRVELHWGRFRREVMDAVRQEAVPTTLRLSRWVRIGGALAAAAAVALVVSVYRLGPGPGPTVNEAVSGRQTGQLLVRLERPAPQPAQPTGEIRIKFARSADLAQAIRVEDETSGQRLSAVRVTAAAPRVSGEALAALLEGLAL